MAESFRRGFGIEDSRLHVIPNGYDADEYAAVPAAQFDHFAIVYAGGLFPPNRRLDPFFESLKLWDAQGKAAPWRFHYYGPYSELAAQSAQQCGVAERVQLHGRVPRHEVLSAVRGAQLTLIVSSVNEHGNNAEKNAITGKIFEPIGLGKPYLVIAPQGADVRDVAATAGGGAVFTGNQIGPMASYLAELAAGRAPPRRNPEAYAWQNLIRTLDSVLRSACGRPTRSSR
jgi:glycosyltransferase involved in cell wall biosynthesis